MSVKRVPDFIRSRQMGARWVSDLCRKRNLPAEQHRECASSPDAARPSTTVRPDRAAVVPTD
eukprot:6177475-Pleurochrysis_carterae.AAC.7